MVDSPHKTGSDVIPVNPKQPGFRQGATPSMVVVDGSSVVHASVVVKATVVLSASSVPRVTVWSHRYSSSWWLNQPVFEKHSVKNGIIFPGIFQNLWNPPPAKTPRMCKRIAICFATSSVPIFGAKKNYTTFPAVTCLPFKFVAPPLVFSHLLPRLLAHSRVPAVVIGLHQKPQISSRLRLVSVELLLCECWPFFRHPGTEQIDSLNRDLGFFNRFFFRNGKKHIIESCTS